MRQVGVVEHRRGRHRHRAWVGDEGIGIGECKLHRFDGNVLPVGAVDRVFGERGVPQDPEAGKRGDALAVRWDLVQRMNPPSRLNRPARLKT